MRRLVLSAPLAVWCAAACSSPAGSTSAPQGNDGGLDGDAALGLQPDTAACTGDATACLSGTASTVGFTVQPRHLIANVFRVFPAGGAVPLASQVVAKDGTWAFSGLAPWAHYFVQIIGEFSLVSGSGASIPALVGPLGVPSSTPTAIQVKPVQLDVLEEGTSGASLQVASASAHVFDPASGAELVDTGASVAVSVAGTVTPMAWDVGSAGYLVQFATPPAAQSSYTITTTIGSAVSSWTLLGTPPSFSGAIASPAGGATVPANHALTVTWSAQPAADYELLEVFAGQTLAWASSPDSPDVTQDTVPAAAISQPGAYLLNVAFAKASCPPTADGCVLENVVADAQITAQ